MKFAQLNDWINDIANLCKPDNIHYCDGSDAEYLELCQKMIDSKMMIHLNSDKRPNSYLCLSDPADTARVESSTYICSQNRDDAGPTNNWMEPKKMKDILLKLFDGCMQGRTMYIVPYCMGNMASDLAKIGVQITDSPYVVCSMRIMARMGKAAYEAIEQKGFIPGVHSVGKPLKEGEKDVPWPCDPDNRYIAHFPDTSEIWSYGSGYGGNALLGKKCLSLRIASALGKKEGWLAEHMLILGLTNPEGEKIYVAAAFPSACGKTNLAMLQSRLPGWKVETVGDDIAWMRFNELGELRAINPEAGFFGVAPGTSQKSNPAALASVARNAIFTNVALTPEGDVWWEGMTKEAPAKLTDWKGRNWTPDSQEPAAHPNSRFTVAAAQCPTIDPNWQDPAGVPISAILFGGRRQSVVPLVCESKSWAAGVLMGASISSETTAANVGEVGKLRHDPFAMLPFCGYHMGDYFAHWLSMEKSHSNRKMPKIFSVNWFRKGQDNNYIWPGFGDNIRVLKWIFGRVKGSIEGVETALGVVPKASELDLNQLEIDPEKLTSILQIDKKLWSQEVDRLHEYFTLFGAKMPVKLTEELNNLKEKLSS